jgi:phage repressor protein C with HTH and peptisase S24 domain
MPAAVISIETKRRAYWSLLEIAQAGTRPIPYGILLIDRDTGQLTQRLRDFSCFEELDEPEFDILTTLAGDLEQKSREEGGLRLLDSLEDSLSGFFRISDRASIAYSDASATVDRLFDEHVDSTVRPFITHLPVYGLRAAATKFGEGVESEQESWVRAPENLRLTEGMFVAYVVGRSMEPLIPDGSACIFRGPVTGSRKGRLLLIEKFGETDFASRYTVKRYARQGNLAESAERDAAIRLEPLNREFEAFDLTSDEFRVVAEFVQVLPS